MWCGVVWCGVVWCGVVWCGVVQCGVVWHGVPELFDQGGGGRGEMALQTTRWTSFPGEN